MAPRCTQSGRRSIVSSVGAIELPTDCKSVADGFNVYGRVGTTSQDSDYADLWKDIWDRVEDHGVDFVHLYKAHTRPYDHPPDI